MPYPKAGWLVFRKRMDRSMIFIPHPQLEPQTYPPSIPLSLGRFLKKQIHIENAPLITESPQFMPARIMRSDDGGYRAGPFVAILTSQGQGTFRGNRQNFVDIIRMGRRMGVTVFVLTPQGIRQGSGTVRGYVLDTRQNTPSWIPATLPMPDVVYNRIPTRSAEQQPKEQEALRFFRNQSHVHLFNPGFFDKWTLNLYINRCPELSRLLPDTALWGNLPVLRNMLQRYDTLYLKPIDGKAGNGMIRVTRQHAGYQTVFQTLSRKHRFLSPNKQELWKLLNRLIQKRKYVIQQGIPLATFRNSPFDLRVLMQKDGTGSWGTTGIGIRLAGENAISTHVPMGGSIEDANVVLSKVFQEQKEELLHEIEKTGIQLARHIEEQQEHPLGEMSMDLGVEQNGRVWFFEANAKPMKFDEPAIREQSLKRLIEYFLYVSGFQRHLSKEV